jgi:hypothetical protein
MSEPAETTPTQAATAAPSRLRSVSVHVLVVVGLVLTIVSLFANFVKREFLDSGNFRSLSSQLIADPAIRDQVAATVVDRAYAKVDVAGQLESTLPSNLSGLAGPIAGASREVTERAVTQALARPAGQALFVAAASRAQRTLVHILDDDRQVVRTTGGVVTLDLTPVVNKVAEQFPIAGRLSQQVPPGSATITVLDSEKLKTAQDATRLLRAIADFVWIPALLAWVGAVWLARGWRRRVVGEIMLGLAFAGLAVVVLRAIAQRYIVENVVASDSVRPAARSAVSILTASLAAAGWAAFAVGALGVAGVWLAGDARRAIAIRRAVSPYAARAGLAWGAFAVAFLLVAWWDPFVSLRNFLIVTVFAGVGFELVRRMAAREVGASGETAAATSEPTGTPPQPA